MRHAGQEVVNRYLARVRAAGDDPDDPNAQTRLAEVIEQLMANASAYNRIRAMGLHPQWNVDLQCWENPRHRARNILTGWLHRHRFYLDDANDLAVIDQITNDLYPATDR
jgi:hypothetical protein